MTVDVDVIVVGAGGCGLSAAIAASEAGASVALLEKMNRPGGNTSLSTGSIPAANTRYQRAVGVEDSPERMVQDLLRQSGPHEAEDLVHLLADQSAALVEWLVEEHQIDLRLITDYKHVGHSVTRLHAPPDRRGESLMRGLLAATRRQDVDVVTGNPVTGLLTEDGRVTGVQVDGSRSGSYELRGHAVVLAANGFGNNKQMLEQWIPEIVSAKYFGAEGSTGEALRWCIDQDAGLGNMTAYQGYAAVAYPHGSIVSWTTVEKGAVLLAPDGRRMGDESTGYSGFASTVALRSEQSFVVLDTTIRDYVASHEPEFAELNEMGGVFEANDAHAVARYIGCAEDTVAAQLSAYHDAARGDRADEHGRKDFGMAPLRAPYCVVRSVPALFHTQGGAAVNALGRVLHQNGNVIPGLYAGGGVTTGLSGAAGAAGYSSGNGLLSALGLGRIAGHVAAADGNSADSQRTT